MTTIPHPSGANHWSHRKPERVLRGPKAPGAKLTLSDITRLYAYADGGWLPHELASHFSVSRQTIWRYLRKRNTR